MEPSQVPAGASVGKSSCRADLSDTLSTQGCLAAATAGCRTQLQRRLRTRICVSPVAGNATPRLRNQKTWGPHLVHEPKGCISADRPTASQHFGNEGKATAPASARSGHRPHNLATRRKSSRTARAQDLTECLTICCWRQRAFFQESNLTKRRPTDRMVLRTRVQSLQKCQRSQRKKKYCACACWDGR